MRVAAVGDWNDLRQSPVIALPAIHFQTAVQRIVCHQRTIMPCQRMRVVKIGVQRLPAEDRLFYIIAVQNAVMPRIHNKILVIYLGKIGGQIDMVFPPAPYCSRQQAGCYRD